MKCINQFKFSFFEIWPLETVYHLQSTSSLADSWETRDIYVIFDLQRTLLPILFMIQSSIKSLIFCFSVSLPAIFSGAYIKFNLLRDHYPLLFDLLTDLFFFKVGRALSSWSDLEERSILFFLLKLDFVIIDSFKFNMNTYQVNYICWTMFFGGGFPGHPGQ